MNMKAIATPPSATIPATRRIRRVRCDSVSQALSASADARTAKRASVPQAQGAKPGGKSDVRMRTRTTRTTNSRTTARTGPGRLVDMPLLDPPARPERRLPQQLVFAVHVGVELRRVLPTAGVAERDDRVALQPPRLVARDIETVV